MLQTIITSGIVCLAVCAFFFITENRDKPTGGRVVKLHPLFLVVAMIAAVLFVGLAVFMAFRSEFAVAWVFIAIGVLAALMILGYFNSRIFFDDTGMTCRNLFGKKTVIPYSEIVSVDMNIDTVIKTARKKITVYNYMRGGTDLLLSIKKYEAGKSTGDRPAPAAQKNKEDKPVRKFSESVNRLSTVVFTYVTCIVIAVGIVAFLMYSLLTDSPLKEDEFFVQFVVVGFAVAAFIVGYVALAVYSAKRAHRSKTLHKIAEKLIPNGYLEDD